MTRTGLLVAFALLASGCSTLPMPAANDDVDNAQVSAVERAALHSGVSVYWVNYPRRKTQQ